MHSSSIRQDQSMHCLLTAGSTLYVKTGKLRLIALPQFLEGWAWQADTVLDADSVYHTEHGGWVELHALKACDLLVQRPEPARRWWHVLMSVWGPSR
ncbi:hypothetical protein [Undibacterium pigrum]|uniref:DUF2917 family protein n=1 Tax=Undibacterium pigrum TaxID=401470 RepID=A0A318J925_9BURK|nr:hypothetical protein [Undibacterium pigrum]PXX44822.1 hypothetical protein DFR42_10234 [Undibacterium pigrum]